jgi:hypothetical protein
VWRLHSERYPIREAELLDLLRRETDLRPEGGFEVEPSHSRISWDFEWTNPTGSNAWFTFREGEVRVKQPDQSTIFRTLAIAADLDAWVVGDDSEIYAIEDGQLTRREPSDDTIASLEPTYITRGSAPGGVGLGQIRPEEWWELATTQSDFRVEGQVEARLPSGPKLIDCPPVATWHGHPSGRAVPFFFDVDLIEVDGADRVTLERMVELARLLKARVLDEGLDEVS